MDFTISLLSWKNLICRFKVQEVGDVNISRPKHFYIVLILEISSVRKYFTHSTQFLLHQHFLKWPFLKNINHDHAIHDESCILFFSKFLPCSWNNQPGLSVCGVHVSRTMASFLNMSNSCTLTSCL